MAHTPQVNRRMDNIRRRMELSRNALAGKLDALTSQFHGVADTAESVTESVESAVDTVQNVRETLSVRRHPLLMVAGALAAGFVGGLLFHHKPPAPAPAPSPPPAPPPAPKRAAEPESALTGAVEALCDRAKRMAVGGALSLARDLIVQEVPADARATVFDLANGLTTQLGGDPLGPLLISPEEITKGEKNGEHDNEEVGGPLGPARREGEEDLGVGHRRRSEGRRRRV